MYAVNPLISPNYVDSVLLVASARLAQGLMGVGGKEILVQPVRDINVTLIGVGPITSL